MRRAGVPVDDPEIAAAARAGAASDVLGSFFARVIHPPLLSLSLPSRMSL
ncbi:MAG: hypothetical protein L0323_08055 [Planctomycetes bacterium]|nr:hypothetical protein [Planctomycetota bacterium]